MSHDEPETVQELETPVLLVDEPRLMRNLSAMAALCRESDVRLRPHVKTHKCVDIARRQRELGAHGFTVAKVSEAAVFADAGLTDLLVAYPLVGSKARALRRLADRSGARLATVVDSTVGVLDLSNAWAGASAPLPVHVKVDVGLGRAGVPVDRVDVVRHVAGAIDAASDLRFEGLLAHAGHAYAADSPEEVARIGRLEGERMVDVANALESDGLQVRTISVGSTPTAPHAVRVAGVTELRVGVYAFHDANQVALGVAGLDDCALTVWTTVVSRPASDRAVCDAGSKTLSSDRGGHGQGSGDYGIVLDEAGAPDPGIRLVALSEEHGWLSVAPDHPLRIGQRLRIVPAHACPVANLAGELWLVDGECVRDRWRVAARGCVA